MVGFAYSSPVPGGGKRLRRRRFLRRMLIAVVVICASIVAAGFWFRRSLPALVASELGRLTNTRVEVGTIGFRFDGSLSIDSLSIRPAGSDPGYDDTILFAKDVYVRFSRRSLLSLSPRLTELRIEEFVLDVQWDLDTGRWNVGTLRFNRSGGKGGAAVPAIQLHDGKLRYSKVSSGKIEVVMAVPVEARFGAGLAHEGYGFEIQTSTLSGGYGQSHLKGYWRPGEFAVAGGLSSADLPSLERAWAVDVLAGQLRYDKNGDYELDLRMKDLHGKHAPEVGALQQITPGGVAGGGPLAGLQGFFARYRPTGTVDSITVDARGNFHRLHESEVMGSVVCKDVSVCDRTFPYAIDHLSGQIDFTQSGLLLRELAGKHGEVDVRIDGWSRRTSDGRQYQYKITTPNMVLDEALYAALTPGQQRLWDAFHPSGTVAAEYWLARSSPTEKRMYVSVDLHGVTAAFREFPYPLTDLTGRLYFDRDSVTATNVVSESGARRILLNAKVTGLGTGKAIHYISIDGNDIPLDATLEKTLPPQYRQMYERLEADGTADVRAQVFTTGDANSVGPMSYRADVVCHSKTLKIEQSPVALSDVIAEVAVSPKSLTIKNLDGWYGPSRVAVTGGVQWASDAKARQFHANVTARDLPVNETTIGLLPASLSERIRAFRPAGSVNLRLKLETPDGDESPVHSGAVECQGLTINHRDLPYPLRDVRGTISLGRGSLDVENITASPVDPCQADESAVIRIGGAATLDSRGLVGGCFSLRTQGLRFTTALGEALPKGLARAYRDVSPSGPFDLDVPNLRISRTTSGESLAEFEGKALLRDCDLRISGTAVELAGDVEVEGVYDAKTGLAKGRAALAGERLVVKGRTISGVTAQAIYDPNTHVWAVDDLLGDCHRGKVLGSLRVEQSETGGTEYVLQASLTHVDLQQFLREGQPSTTAEAPYSGGLMNATLSLGGRAGDLASRRGVCQIDIENMRIGRVSPLRNLLSVLSLNEPTDYTFERMIIDSYIRQDMLLIRKLDMSGRNVAFTGAGTMALPTGNLNLMLTARGQRLAAAEPSVFQALTEGLGGAVVRIEVTGTASAPVVQTKTLPVIEDSLRILGKPE
ncbi:MAG: hypothetical protein GX448_12520 [Planctomycetes bacterium]|nr:hypothetical protein [Planctomycetota bacterium]